MEVIGKRRRLFLKHLSMRRPNRGKRPDHQQERPPAVN
jgi:hypothetical protein